MGFVPSGKSKLVSADDYGKAVYRDDVQKILAAAKLRKSLRKFRSTIPKGLLRKFRQEVQNKGGCRIYGQLEIHKCQGDFHITARGHGYISVGQEHLDHDSI